MVCEEDARGERGGEATRHFSTLTSCYPAHVRLFLVPCENGRQKAQPVREKSIHTPKSPAFWKRPHNSLVASILLPK